MTVWAWVSIAVGIFTLCGAYFDWDWFFNARNPRFFVNIFTRKGARIFYALVGIALIVFGLIVLTGILDLQP